MLAAVAGVDRESAREAAADELARAVYRQSEPGLVQRALQWLGDRVVELLEAVGRAGVPGRVGLLVAAALVVLVVVAVGRRTGAPARLSASARGSAGQLATAADHRRLAESLAEQGRWADAVRERMRALVRELEQQGLLLPRGGLTAGEVAAEAGALAPGLARDLRAAASVFDEVWYGGRGATPEAVRRVAEVDERVRRGRGGRAGGATASGRATTPGTDSAPAGAVP